VIYCIDARGGAVILADREKRVGLICRLAADCQRGQPSGRGPELVSRSLFCFAVQLIVGCWRRDRQKLASLKKCPSFTNYPTFLKKAVG
jgi:hypothetical protein